MGEDGRRIARRLFVQVQLWNARMSLFRDKYRIESTRLKTWDYSWPWWYYITIVVKDRRGIFAEVVESSLEYSPLGAAVESCWRRIPEHHKGVELDEYVIMPNHLHGIVILGEDCRDVQLNVSTKDRKVPEQNPFSSISPKKGSLSVVIRTFKAAVTTWARANGHSDFAWQERFYDHIIRNDKDLHRIRQYIANNPLKWALDEENPPGGRH